ncbi:unnamed protein product [Prorocentrum cordatum]|uniref:Uncharacterized protein n=1 Tax=Prorocentrum cordatum TaxID=2364126 RepID=A0ABN9XSK9_9DINO|nr:unnamed protein product [Polarella glacialis]
MGRSSSSFSSSSSSASPASLSLPMAAVAENGPLNLPLHVFVPRRVRAGAPLAPRPCSKAAGLPPRPPVAQWRPGRRPPPTHASAPFQSGRTVRARACSRVRSGTSLCRRNLSKQPKGPRLSTLGGIGANSPWSATAKGMLSPGCGLRSAPFGPGGRGRFQRRNWYPYRYPLAVFFFFFGLLGRPSSPPLDSC